MATSHYLNQCWNIVNWTLRNKLQWNFNRNSNIFNQENTPQNAICEMASILSRPQCVKDDISFKRYARLTRKHGYSPMRKLSKIMLVTTLTSTSHFGKIASDVRYYVNAFRGYLYSVQFAVSIVIFPTIGYHMQCARKTCVHMTRNKPRCHIILSLQNWYTPWELQL